MRFRERTCSTSFRNEPTRSSRILKSLSRSMRSLENFFNVSVRNSQHDDTYGEGSNSSSSMFFTSVLAYLTFYPKPHKWSLVKVLFITFWPCRFSPTCNPFFALSQSSGRGWDVVVVVVVVAVVVVVGLVFGFQSWGLSTDFSIRRKRRTRVISSCEGWNSCSMVCRCGPSGFRKQRERS